MHSPAPNKWLRRLLCVLATLFGGLAAALVIGAVIPETPILGTIGTIFEGLFTLHIEIMACVGLCTALLAKRLGAKHFITGITALSALAVLGGLVPLWSLVAASHREGASISWIDHLRTTAEGPTPKPNQTITAAIFGGRPLRVDIYLPDAATGRSKSTPVFMMHGGGFIYGNRSDGRDWDRWLSKRGYTVFDVDYRLAPPLTWNIAGEDVACAMVWAQNNAKMLNIAPNHALLVGQSAGASLALQVSYGLGDGSVKSSCGGSAPQPIATFALYPADDMVLAWNSNLTLGPLNLQDSLKAYIGGSPQQFPDRYRAVSPIDHVRSGLPATFIAYGQHDHLVPIAGHPLIAAQLTRLGVANTLLAIPYSDHGFDLAWGSLGAQITRHVLSGFLLRHCPARNSGS
jgi:acetyl esterase/lipase